MGRCECVSVYIGMKFRIKDLIEHLDETQLFNILKTDNIYIVDHNNNYNNVFEDIYLSDKETLIRDLKHYGDKMEFRGGGYEQVTYDNYESYNECLYNQEFIYVDKSFFKF